LEKKHVIKLHKEQINYLKQTLRDLQFELGKINTVDFEYIKAVFISLIKEIPQQSEKTESIIDLLSSLLNLSESDRASLRESRTSPFSLINN
jgi:ABC-type enterochelin transport system substrate-binding protein